MRQLTFDPAVRGRELFSCLCYGLIAGADAESTKGLELLAAQYGLFQKFAAISHKPDQAPPGIRELVTAGELRTVELDDSEWRLLQRLFASPSTRWSLERAGVVLEAARLLDDAPLVRA